LPQERRLVTEIPGPHSAALLARRAKAVSRAVSTMLPVFIERAGGGVLVDVDGNSLIDFGSGIAVVSVGNAADEVVAGVRDQVGQFTHTCFMITPYEGYVAVCEELASRTPGDHDKRSALFNSGAEAVENAVKIARSHTGRPAVVAFDHAYHGRTNLTMALTAKSMPYKHRFGPFAPEVYRMPMAYPYRWPTGPENCGPEAAAEVMTMIDKQVGAEIMDSIHVGGLGGTYGGNPVSCAAALGAIRTIEEHDLIGAARRIESIMLPRLRELQQRYPAIGDVRGRGAMLAVEVVTPGSTTPDPATTQAVAQACHQAGLVVLTCGTFGNVLRFLPPLVIPEHLLREGLDLVDEAFGTVADRALGDHAATADA